MEKKGSAEKAVREIGGLARSQRDYARWPAELADHQLLLLGDGR